MTDALASGLGRALPFFARIDTRVRTVIIGLVASYAVLYYLGRFYASYTTWLHDNETELASSLTLMLTARGGSSSRRGMWRTIYFDAWAGKQVVASASLRRFVTAELREVFTLIAWFSLIGTVAVEWPGFACTVVRSITALGGIDGLRTRLRRSGL